MHHVPTLKTSAAAAALVCAGLAVGYLAALAAAPREVAAQHQTDHRVIAGLNGDSVWWTQSWHDDETRFDVTALDLVPHPLQADPQGHPVWFQSFKVSGQDLFAVPTDHRMFSPCTGIDMVITDAANFLVGRIHYAHIAMVPGLEDFYNLDDAWTVFPLGTLSGTQPMGCAFRSNPPGSPPAHLHQSGTGAAVTHNAALATDPAEHVIEPTFDIDTNWIHKLGPITDDRDGDGWDNDIETFLTTDPLSPCGAGAAGTGAWPPDTDNTMGIGLADVFSAFDRINAVEPDPDYSRRVDFDASGGIGLSDVFVPFNLINSSCVSVEPFTIVPLGQQEVAAVTTGAADQVAVDLDGTGNANNVVASIESTTTVGVGEEITVDVVVRGAVNLSGFNIQVDYDPAVVQLKEVGKFLGFIDSSLVGFLAKDGASVTRGHVLDSATAPQDVHGTFDIVALVQQGNEVSGEGFLVQLVFTAVGPGATEISLTRGAGQANGMFADASGTATGEFDPATITDGMVTVTAAN